MSKQANRLRYNWAAYFLRDILSQAPFTFLHKGSLYFLRHYKAEMFLNNPPDVNTVNRKKSSQFLS